MIENFTLIRLKIPTSIKPFNCDDDDLNSFLFEDAKAHLNQLLSVTYLLESNEETVAYFSVLNDSIRRGDTNRSALKRMLQKMPFKKRSYKSHPAVKVGRFAVNSKYKRQGVGTELMDYIKGYFIDSNKTGCRFITVDAYNKEDTIRFYQKNGFDFLTSADRRDERRLMFFDLITLMRD